MHHIMIDLETFGHTSNSVIESISMVKFTKNSIMDELYLPLNIQTQLNNGAKITEGTLLWWLDQGKKARKAITSVEDRVDIESTINILENWMTDDNNTQYFIWGNSARFDCGILSDLFVRNNKEIPWKFWDERCHRTMMSLPLGQKIKKSHEFVGIKHKGIDDCKNQVAQLQLLNKSIPCL